MASTRSRSAYLMRLPCVRAFVGSLVCEPNILSAHSMIHASLSVQPRQALAWLQAYGVHPIAVDLSISPSMRRAFVGSPSANRTSLTLFYDPRPTQRVNQACGLAPRHMASLIAVDLSLIRLPCVSIRWLIRLRTEHHFPRFILYDPACLERPTRRVAWPPRRMASPDRGRLIPIHLPCVRGWLFVCERTSFTLFMIHANRASTRRVAWPPGVWRPPFMIDLARCYLYSQF